MANWLEDKFEEFYVKLIEQLDTVGSGRESMPADTADAKLSAPWQAMSGLFQSQRAEAERLSVASARYYQDALYAMVALADQKFIHTPWYGQKAWRASTLEWHFFESAEAGRKFFENAERLLSNPDPGAKEVCKLYYTCIALGFRGIYSDPSGQEEVRKLRQRLLAHFLPMSSTAQKISPAAYQHTREEDLRGFLPPIGIPIAGLLIAGILAYAVHYFAPKWALQSLIENSTEIEKKTQHPKEPTE